MYVCVGVAQGWRSEENPWSQFSPSIGYQELNSGLHFFVEASLSSESLARLLLGIETWQSENDSGWWEAYGKADTTRMSDRRRLGKKNLAWRSWGGWWGPGWPCLALVLVSAVHVHAALWLWSPLSLLHTHRISSEPMCILMKEKPETVQDSFLQGRRLGIEDKPSLSLTEALTPLPLPHPCCISISIVLRFSVFASVRQGFVQCPRLASKPWWPIPCSSPPLQGLLGMCPCTQLFFFVSLMLSPMSSSETDSDYVDTICFTQKSSWEFCFLCMSLYNEHFYIIKIIWHLDFRI